MLGLPSLKRLFNTPQPAPVVVERDEQPEPEQVWITIGDSVTVLADDSGNTYEEGEFVGQVRIISVSPYYAEELQGIIRVYVVGNVWTGWILPGDLKLFTSSQSQIETAIA
jgi:hypothetical protein